MDHCFDVEIWTYWRYRTADGDIAVAWRRRRQLPVEIRRRRMHSLAQILAEWSSLAKPGLLISGKLIPISKAGRGMRLMLAKPVMGHLRIVLAELSVSLSLLVVSLAPILGYRYDSAENQRRNYMTVFSHEFDKPGVAPSLRGSFRPPCCF